MSRLAAAALAGAVMLAAAPSAAADATIRAQPTLRYDATEATIDQGGRVTFENDDVGAQHNLTALATDPAGHPLFASATIGPGQTAQVAGTEYLTAGDYSFYCTVHPEMHGTLRVTSAGAPRGAPGTEPDVKVVLLTRSLPTALRRGRVLVHVRSGDPVLVSLVARARGRRIATGASVLSRAGFRGARLPLTRAGRRLLAKVHHGIRVSVSATATDPTGRVARLATVATMRRPRR